MLMNIIKYISSTSTLAHSR